MSKSAVALKQYMELANTISNQALAIVQGKIPGKQLWAQVGLLENNIKTLKAWTPRPDDVKEGVVTCSNCGRPARTDYAYSTTVCEQWPLCTPEKEE